MILPLVLGLVVDAVVPRWAARLRPVAMTTSSVALVVLVTATVVLNVRAFGDLVGTGALPATFLLIAGAFGMGYLISGPGFDRRTVMGLGAGQRNVAAALVVATQDLGDSNTLVMVVAVSVIDLLVLFPIAWILRRSTRGLPPPAREDLAGSLA
jgi:BASS family bile acid:Na+ symporter